MRHSTVAALITAVAVVLAAAPAAAQHADAGWTPARTPWGHPDLQGIWDQTTGTPPERAAEGNCGMEGILAGHRAEEQALR